ncbi:putative leader peptide [Streptomyces celluloflavus]|uniref:putative leader peptide n=1 Tax=Streptomyces celluloflavus TaxID=58344 RepID=UPI0036770E3A
MSEGGRGRPGRVRSEVEGRPGRGPGMAGQGLGKAVGVPEGAWLTLREPPCFTPKVTDHGSRFWRRVHLDLVRYAGCMCRPSS